MMQFSKHGCLSDYAARNLRDMTGRGTKRLLRKIVWAKLMVRGYSQVKVLDKKSARQSVMMVKSEEGGLSAVVFAEILL